MTGDLGPRARIVFIAVLVGLAMVQWLLHEPTKTEEPRGRPPPGPLGGPPVGAPR